MLTLTWKQVRDRGFMSAMVQLNNSREMDATTSYRVGRICVACKKAAQESDTAGRAIHEKHAKTIDLGGKKVPETDPQGNFVYATPDGYDKAEAEFEKLLEEKTIEIKSHKLDFTKLKGLMGIELTAVEIICDNVPEIA